MMVMKIKMSKAQKSVSWEKNWIWRLSTLFKSNLTWKWNKPLIKNTLTVDNLEQNHK